MRHLSKRSNKTEASPHTPQPSYRVLLEAIEILINHANTISENENDPKTKAYMKISYIDRMLPCISQIGTFICGSPLIFSYNSIIIRDNGNLHKITLTEGNEEKLTATFELDPNSQQLFLKHDENVDAWNAPIPTQSTSALTTDGSDDESGIMTRVLRVHVEQAIAVLSEFPTHQIEEDEEPSAELKQDEADKISQTLKAAFSEFPASYQGSFLAELAQQQEELRDSKNLDHFNQILKSQAELLRNIRAHSSAQRPDQGDFRIEISRSDYSLDPDKQPTTFEIGSKPPESIIAIFDRFNESTSNEEKTALLQVQGLLMLNQIIHWLMKFEGYNVTLSQLEKKTIIKFSSNGKISQFNLGMIHKGTKLQTIQLNAAEESARPSEFDLNAEIPSLTPCKINGFSLSDRDDYPEYSRSSAGKRQVEQAIDQFIGTSFGGLSKTDIVNLEHDEFEKFLDHLDEQVSLLAPFCILNKVSVKEQLYFRLIDDIVRNKIQNSSIDIDSESFQYDYNSLADQLSLGLVDQKNMGLEVDQNPLHQKRLCITMLKNLEPAGIAELFKQSLTSIGTEKLRVVKKLFSDLARNTQAAERNSTGPEAIKNKLDVTIEEMFKSFSTIELEELKENEAIASQYAELIIAIAIENEKLPPSYQTGLTIKASQHIQNKEGKPHPGVENKASDVIENLQYIFDRENEKNIHLEEGDEKESSNLLFGKLAKLMGGLQPAQQTSDSSPYPSDSSERSGTPVLTVTITALKHDLHYIQYDNGVTQIVTRDVCEKIKVESDDFNECGLRSPVSIGLTNSSNPTQCPLLNAYHNIDLLFRLNKYLSELAISRKNPTQQESASLFKTSIEKTAEEYKKQLVTMKPNESEEDTSIIGLNKKISQSIETYQVTLSSLVEGNLENESKRVQKEKGLDKNDRLVTFLDNCSNGRTKGNAQERVQSSLFRVNRKPRASSSLSQLRQQVVSKLKGGRGGDGIH